MADEATRYGVEAGIGGLGIILGIATGDKDLTRMGYKSVSETTRIATGTQAPQATTAPTPEPPKALPGKVDQTPAVVAIPATPKTRKGPEFDPFTLEPK